MGGRAVTYLWVDDLERVKVREREMKSREKALEHFALHSEAASPAVPTRGGNGFGFLLSWFSFDASVSASVGDRRFEG